MGAVYAGLQESLGRRVAIKILHPHLAEDASLLARFELEARAAAALGHPHIVAVTDFQQPAGEPAFLVMELLTGASLREVIGAEGALTHERVAFIASQVLSALVSAHEAGIVHRDLKPDNVFLTSLAGVSDVVKVLDFGIAKLGAAGFSGGGGRAAIAAPGTPRMTVTGDVLGTPGYMSPEQARGREVDARTDLYATGALMYHALSGRAPFEEPNYNAQIAAIIERDPLPLGSLRPEVPPEFIAIVERAMAKSPDARFATANEMHDALAPFVRATKGGPAVLSIAPKVARATVPAPSSDPYAATEMATTGRKGLRFPRIRVGSIRTVWVVASMLLVFAISIAAWWFSLGVSEERIVPEDSQALDAPSEESGSPVTGAGPGFPGGGAGAASVRDGFDAGATTTVGLEARRAAADVPRALEPATPPTRHRRMFRKKRIVTRWDVRLTGGITNNLYSIDHLRERLTRQWLRIRRCFDAVRAAKNASVYIDLIVWITEKGDVRDVSVPGGLVHDAALLLCLREAVLGVALGHPQRSSPNHVRLFLGARPRRKDP
jgi:serine/threonine-protein kinase